MRYLLASLAISILMLLGISHAAAQSTPPATYFVSPSGNDSNSGTIDQPFLTLDHARDVVRPLLPGMQSNITIYLRGGRYELAQPFTLTAQDSAMNGFDVVYRNYPGENPLLSGGVVVTDWTLWQDGIWRARTQGGADSRQLYVNGKRAVRARSNGVPGFVKTATGFKTTLPTAGWKNVGDMEMVSRTVWKTYRCPIAGAAAGVVNVQQPCWGFTQNPSIPTIVILKNVSWLENSLSFLDTPGEWYLDKSTNFLYYKPRAGENMHTASVILPKLQTLVRGAGVIDAPLHDITFEGITFADATWLAPNSNIGFAERQANTYYVSRTVSDTRMIPAAVTFDFINNSSIVNNNFIRLGQAGLSLTHAKNNLIGWNALANISGSGILLGELEDIKRGSTTPVDSRLITSGNAVYDNTIQAIGREYEGGVGIWLGFTRDSVVRNNEISNVPYTGISIGWAGPGTVDPSIAKNNVVKANYIHDYMKVLQDGGGIYSLGAQPQNLYTHNVIVNGPHSNGGIYIDNDSRYIEVTANVDFANKRSAIVNGGDNYVHDNFWQNRYKDDILVMHFPYCQPTDCGSQRIVNNHLITALDQSPAAIRQNAGLENVNPYDQADAAIVSARALDADDVSADIDTLSVDDTFDPATVVDHFGN
jgi:hypothetical protein